MDSQTEADKLSSALEIQEEKIAEQNSLLQKLHNRNQGLESEIERLKMALQAQQDDAGQHQEAQLAAGESEIARLKMAVQAQQDQGRQQEQLAGDRERDQDLESEIERLKIALESLQAGAGKQEMLLQAQLAAGNKRDQELESEIERLKMALQAQHDDADKQQEQANSEHVQELENEIERLKMTSESLQDLENRNMALEKEIEKSIPVITTLKHELVEQESQQKQLAERNQAISSQNLLQKEQITELVTEIEVLQARLNALSRREIEMEHLQKHVTQMEVTLEASKLASETAISQTRCDKASWHNVMTSLEIQLNEAKMAREDLTHHTSADREMMQQAFNDLQIQLDEMRLDKHNVEVTAQQDLRKLTEALQKTEQQLKLKEQELQRLHLEMIEKESDVATCSRELRQAEMRWAKQKATLVGEVEHLKHQGEMLLRDLMSTTEAFQC